MGTLSIQLPDSIHEHAKRLAQDEGASVNQLVSSALAEESSQAWTATFNPRKITPADFARIDESLLGDASDI